MATRTKAGDVERADGDAFVRMAIPGSLFSELRAALGRGFDTLVSVLHDLATERHSVLATIGLRD